MRVRGKQRGWEVYKDSRAGVRDIATYSLIAVIAVIRIGQDVCTPMVCGVEASER